MYFFVCLSGCLQRNVCFCSRLVVKDQRRNSILVCWAKYNHRAVRPGGFPASTGTCTTLYLSQWHPTESVTLSHIKAEKKRRLFSSHTELLFSSGCGGWGEMCGRRSGAAEGSGQSRGDTTHWHGFRADGSQVKRRSLNDWNNYSIFLCLSELVLIWCMKLLWVCLSKHISCVDFKPKSCIDNFCWHKNF